jgi:hypothetical protein
MTAQSDFGKGSTFVVVITMEVSKKEKNLKPMVARVGKRVTPEVETNEQKSMDPAVLSTLRDFISLFEFSPQKVEQLVNKKGFDELRSYLQSIRSICVATHSKELLNSVVNLVQWAESKGTKGDASKIVAGYKQKFLELQKKVEKGN